MQLASIDEPVRIDVSLIRHTLASVRRLRIGIVAARITGALAITMGVALIALVLTNPNAALPAWFAAAAPKGGDAAESLSILLRAVGPMALIVAGAALIVVSRITETVRAEDAKSKATGAAIKVLRRNSYSAIETIDTIRWSEYGSRFSRERGVAIVAEYRRDGAAIEGQMNIVDGGGLRFVERELR